MSHSFSGIIDGSSEDLVNSCDVMEDRPTAVGMDSASETVVYGSF